MTYIYDNISIEPNTDKIHINIIVSDMINKNILFCIWESETKKLKIEFDNELIGSDKMIVDNIVFSSGECPEYKTRIEITNEIWNNLSSQDQGLRLQNALSKYPFFILHIDSENYIEAKNIMALALGLGDIIQADYDLIEGILPECGQ